MEVVVEGQQPSFAKLVLERVPRESRLEGECQGSQGSSQDISGVSVA